jgi:hypothetical protein
MKAENRVRTSQHAAQSYVAKYAVIASTSRASTCIHWIRGDIQFDEYSTSEVDWKFWEKSLCQRRPFKARKVLVHDAGGEEMRSKSGSPS